MKKVIDIKSIKKKKIRKYIIYALFVIISIYVLYAIYLLVKTPTDTVVVERGTLTLEESSTGYIIREEQVIKGENYKNGIIPIISEKERAAKKQAVFRYMADDEENLKKQIEEIDLKIQDAISKQSNIFPADVKNLEKQIDEKVEKLHSLTDIQKIAEYKKEISNIVTKKAKMIGESSSSGSYIKELTEKREEYEKALTEGSEYVSAPEAGLVSYRVDGLENVLTTKDFSSLTEDKLEGLGLKTGKIVPTNNESAKIVNNFMVYIVAILDSDAAKNAKVEDKITITLSSGTEFDAEIAYTQVQESGKMLIVLRLDRLNDELLEYRKISFNITWWSKSRT